MVSFKEKSLGTLATILKDNWEWRSQIWHLAVFELKKQSRGAVLGWAWFLVQPIIYVFCFWFALEIGLRASGSLEGDGPYLLWLACGIIPWFFMRSMLGGGVDVLHKFSYLVKKVKFPISAITSVYTLSALLTELIVFIVLFAVYFASGRGFEIYLLQVPVLVIFMVAFWWFFSLLMSPLCAMSRDAKNFMNALSTPLFWLSGVLFSVSGIHNEIIQGALLFNPITFLVDGFRDAMYMRAWVWDDPAGCLAFLAVFVFTAFVALVVYKKTNEEVADVL